MHPRFLIPGVCPIAGQPGANAFSWHDTITHVGSLVFIPTVGNTSESLDLDDVTVTGR